MQKLPLKGIAARTLMRTWSLSPICLALLVLAFIFGFAANGQSDDSRKAALNSLFFVLLYLGLGLLVLCGLAISMAAFKVRREIAAGYTTFAMSTLPVDVIDPKSGAVIRGKLEEPFKSKAAYQEAIRRARGV